MARERSAGAVGPTGTSGLTGDGGSPAVKGLSAAGGSCTTNALAAAIQHAATELPHHQACRLAGILAGFPGPTGAARQAALAVVPTAGFRARAAEVMDAWLAAGSGVGGAGIALAVETAAGTAATLRAAQSLEVVWTGPSSPVIPVRSTVAVLQGLVDHARHDLLVVSFAAYKVPAVVQALAGAVARGVKVRLVLDSAIEAGGKLTHDAKAAFGALGHTVTFYEWPAESRQIPGGGIAAMHAKAAVADGRSALVTSANLTGQALAANMELGLLIQGGPVPRRVAAHFGELIASGTLRRVDG